MKKYTESKHCIDVLFSLILLLLFSMAALSVLVIGFHVYQNTIRNMNTNYTTHTALTYVAEKIRQHDSTKTVFIGSIEDTPALLLQETIDEVPCVTYIYEDEHMLKELFVQKNTEVSKDQGESILKIQDFSIEELSGNFLRITIRDAQKNPLSLLIYLRSMQERSAP
ncbi:MAG: DUF4860 domain-containing protein [Blautia sp.]